VRAVYRKVHLWEREPEWFAAGDESPPVVGGIAAIVCFDLFFAEWVRIAALRGARLLCVPGNWPEGPWPPVQRLRAQVAAEANAMAVALADRCGSERGHRWAGATAVAAPDGRLLAAAPAPEPAVVEAEVELARNPPAILAARRPELYGPLSDP
jgi:predicted amidohydrolase